MDTMRNLNKSLPNSSPKPRIAPPPEQLLQSFKTAALSVTNLYKTAALDQTRAREGGYQDALDELLAFLDKENLGLGDGEGWRVRQWATERLDGTPPAQVGSDSDDDRIEPEKRAESPSPVRQRKPSPETASVQPPSRSSSPVRTEPIPPPPPLLTHRPATIPARSESFTFRSNHSYPLDIDMQSHETPASALPQSETPLQPQTTTTTPTAAVRLEVVSRGSRTPHRHGNHSNRHNTRSTTSARALGSSAGSKRKTAFGEFFDIGNLGDGKDGFGGGGKRGRLS
ncbi:MAG: hypothetical protein Q9187_002994 [Circinaria calcarea]